MSQIDAFAEYVARFGYAREPTKGIYEVLRLRKASEPPVIFYKRDQSDHASCTLDGPARHLVSRWLRYRRAQRGAKKGAFVELTRTINEGCKHPEIVESERRDDGSIDGRCTACGESGFPIRDVPYEKFLAALDAEREEPKP